VVYCKKRSDEEKEGGEKEDNYFELKNTLL